jgi:hypothetical protein
MKKVAVPELKALIFIKEHIHSSQLPNPEDMRLYDELDETFVKFLEAVGRVGAHGKQEVFDKWIATSQLYAQYANATVKDIIQGAYHEGDESNLATIMRKIPI